MGTKMTTYIIELKADVYYRDELCRALDRFGFDEKLVLKIEGKSLEYKLTLADEGLKEDEISTFLNKAADVIVETYNSSSNKKNVYFRNCRVTRIYKPIAKVNMEVR